MSFNSHSRICQKPLDFISTQISDLITSYFKNHVTTSSYFRAFDLMECNIRGQFGEWIKFAPHTMDILKEDANDLLWKTFGDKRVKETLVNTVFFGLPVEFELMLYFICSAHSGTNRFKLLLDQSELTIMIVKRASEGFTPIRGRGGSSSPPPHNTITPNVPNDGSISYTSYIGIEDVDCKTIDLTYVKVASSPLHERIASHIAIFAKALREDHDNRYDKPPRGCIALTFAANRRGSWVLGSEPSAWERWVFNVELISITSNDGERREEFASQLKGKLLYVLDCINAPESSLPELGSSQIECDTVIDFSMPEVSPYRFNVTYFPGATQAKQSKPSGIRRF
ncbi:hypothetical protein TcWFU_006785 [Taenia crassiceps]|uniref:Autophagy-related protein 101 n=1 Tax=Taenia crassiceps TaxID=6207 RepID=A0ABR4QRU9_9CEST